ncbi:MAG: 4Fe-4S dicluster domain-containing protein [Candidatus Bathyarchaeota archaeon]|nr:MAG: 4Fe-4S dicluster domain-containing protein [Candidatus Bathyarchaeota archaeon]
MKHESKKEPSNLTFSEELRQKMLGETINLCYQCGTCASSCPVAKLDPRFNPREVIKLALLGEREEVLSSEAIWLCCSCFNCDERCPQRVAIALAIYALRNIAFKEGHIPKIYSEFASALSNDGRIVKISKFVEKKRPTLGLPSLKPTGVEALRKILSTTAFEKLQQKEGEK